MKHFCKSSGCEEGGVRYVARTSDGEPRADRPHTDAHAQDAAWTSRQDLCHALG